LFVERQTLDLAPLSTKQAPSVLYEVSDNRRSPSNPSLPSVRCKYVLPSAAVTQSNAQFVFAVCGTEGATFCGSSDLGVLCREMDETRLQWTVRWRTRQWQDDGAIVVREGDDVISAPTADAAVKNVESRLFARLGWERPFETRVECRGARHSTQYRPMSLATTVPAREELRHRRRAGARVDELAGQLASGTPLGAMLALAVAFNLDLDALAAVPELLTNAASGFAVADLERAIDDQERVWDLPRRIREAHAAGRTVEQLTAEHAAGANGTQLSLALREAFNIRRGEKMLLDVACSERDEAAFAAALANCEFRVKVGAR
jgi:hypothetical protein